MGVEERGVPANERRGMELAELSNAIVGLYKELFGRGPTKARSDYAGPDVVLCTLEDSLTPVEQAMLDLGQAQRLRETRMLFQYTTSDRFIGAAEQITGRKVRGFVSGMDVENDIAAEIFYLEPRDRQQGARNGRG